MATKVHMEALSPTMEEGQIVRWLMAEGDAVESGDVLAEIETDKATMELVARGDGVLRKQLLGEGATAPVGAVIGVIGEADEDIGAIVEEAGVGAGTGTPESPEASVPETEAAAAASSGKADAKPAGAVAGDAPAEEAGPRTDVRPAGPAPGGDDGRVKASPLARRLAREAGLALEGLAGSGPGGRIVRRDVEALQRGGGVRQAGAGTEAGVQPAAAYEGPDVEEVPVTQMRKTIAKRLVTSIGPVPTFYLTIDVDMTQMVGARERINERLAADGLKISVNDMLLKATAMALRQHPEVNAAWHEDHIKRYHRVHLGVAVAVEDGLITPVVRDAHGKGVAQIGAEVRELAGRAREKRLQPEEYTGATFSVSNLGMFGIQEFTAIINPPEAGILAVGQLEERPVVDEDGDLVVQPRMKMTMSCDHRVVDGATGARFLQTLRAYLEEPAMMMV
jgi:pyruvate dehydrogenase E2 component (dihydrolipoamide acetyltransferase)